VLSRRVMILIAMSAKITGFKKLKEEYESCPDFGKYMSRYGTALFERWTVFCYKKAIYSGFVNYIFLVRFSEIFSLRKYMLEVWLDISVRTRQLRLLNTDSTGRV